MRVGILSYPMLFQRHGGLQIQVRATIAALNRSVGEQIQVELVDPCHTMLTEYDLIHVFSAINGNHRIVEAATDMGVPVVLSPLVSPGWDRASGMRARIGDRLLGKMTDWNVQSSYAHIRRALQLADLIVALGDAESASITSGFLIDREKIRVFPNGMDPRFFDADPGLFRARTGIREPFVLCVGSISRYKNQLGLARALAPLCLPLVVIGAAGERDTDYLQELRRARGVICLGALAHTDPLLASAYAAATVFALPSRGEVFPLTVLEAMAAGTPVVLTAESALALPDSGFALRKVVWDDGAALLCAVSDLVSVPPARAAVQALVRDYTWDSVAAQIAACYVDLTRRAAHAKSLNQ